MGKFLYGRQGMAVDIDDRSLAHLQVVITSKLRRGECFLFSWTDALDAGSGRSSVWLGPSIPLYFRYVHGGASGVNREWLAELMASANGSSGLRFTPEPGIDTAIPESHV